MPDDPWQLLADLAARVAAQETRTYPWQYRVSASTAGSAALSAASGYAAPGDAAGPDVTVRVGPSGRLLVAVSARLTTTSGTAPRLAMGWQATGPYLDEERTTSPAEVAPAVVVAASDARALAVLSGEITATREAEVIGLVPGWYLVQARYAATGTTPQGTASLRELVAVPL